jgi:signal transduction histidine kinase
MARVGTLPRTRLPGLFMTSSDYAPMSRGAFWLMLRRIALLAGCVDVLYLVVFLLLGMPVMAAVNVLSCAMYALAYLLLTRRRNLPAVLLMWTEVLVHAGVSTVLLGWATGIHYFLLVFIPAVAVSRSQRQAFLALGFLLAVYIGLDAVTQGVPVRYPLEPAAVTLLRWLNICVVFLMFGAIGRDYVRRVELAEKRVREMTVVLERERIARELHDTLLQSVNGLILQFHAAAQRIPAEHPAREMMEVALASADDALAEGRDRVAGLRAAPLGGRADLGDALSVVGDQLAAQYRVDFALQRHGPMRKLQPQAMDEAYRIGREALINAFRHARAHRVTVHLHHRPEGLRLEVRDDGVGIDRKVVRGVAGAQRWGLLGMRERAQRMGGRLTIRSSTGRGTWIVLELDAAQAFAATAAKGGPAGPMRAGRASA